jgi:hypothetical protein
MDIMFDLPGGPFDFERGVVSYWGSGDELFDVTTLDDSARLVAEVVLDPRAENRVVEFAGEVINIHGIVSSFEQIAGRKLELRTLGSVDDLRRWIDATKATARSPFEYVFAQYGWAQLHLTDELPSHERICRVDARRGGLRTVVPFSTERLTSPRRQDPHRRTPFAACCP